MARVVLPAKRVWRKGVETAKNEGMRAGEKDGRGGEGDLALLREYGNYLRVERGLRPLSCEAYRGDLLLLAEFVAGRGVTLLGAGSEDVQGCLQHLREHGMESRTVARKLSCWRGFYRWLLKDGRTRRDPLVNLESPSSWTVLPKSIAETDVAEMLDRLAAGAQLGGEGLSGALALRDHALLELLYAGGLRVGEVVALRVEDLQVGKGQVQVRGKGDKERLIPLGVRAMAALERYMAEGRESLLRARRKERAAKGAEAGTMFLSARGRPLTSLTVWTMVRKHGGAGMSPHKLRHSCATHMVSHGADLRTVQTLLGHADIGTTQVYTHLAIDRLKAVHRMHHPRGSRRVSVEPAEDLETRVAS